MKAYFLSDIFVFAWFLHVDTRPSSSEIFLACMKRELGESYNKPDIGNYENDSEYWRCQRQCDMEGVGTIVNGKVILEKVKNIKIFYDQMYTPEQCAALTTTEKCDLGDKLVDCIFKRKPVHVHRRRSSRGRRHKSH